MCGIVLVAGKLMVKHDKIFKDLLIADSLRGIDSTGIAAVRLKGDVHVAKQVGDPFNLFADKRFDKAMMSINKVLIGHNRWATTGTVNRANAHPFEFDSLVGVHNGTLHNKYEFDKEKEYEVDSEALYAHIDTYGIVDAITKARGAWALVYWNKEEQTLNLIRNKERPFSIALNKLGTVFYGASERWMLEGCVNRNDEELDEVLTLEADSLLSLPIDNEGTIGKPTVRKLEGAPPFVQQPQQGRVVNIRGTTGGSQTKPTGTNQKTEDKGGTNIDNSNSFTRDYSAEYAQSKKVLLEMVTSAQDQYGSEYCFMYDNEHPGFEIRLYSHSSHAVQTLPSGTMITADIASFVGSTSGGYYKASPWSVQVMPSTDDEGDGLDAELIPDLKDKHHYINRANWMKKYPECACCNDMLIPEQANVMTTEGQALCADCAEEYKDMVKVIH